jgi:hypothetical protein
MRRLLFDIALLTGFSAVGAVGCTLVTPKTDMRHPMIALAIFASVGAASVGVGLLAPASADGTSKQRVRLLMKRLPHERPEL